MNHSSSTGREQEALIQFVLAESMPVSQTTHLEYQPHQEEQQQQSYQKSCSSLQHQPARAFAQRKTCR
uniref:Uncharacterized protein n=1 Tax=Lotus japonicus TaxID=34305 RepID=I3SKV5_LOTJA|nr:unknown [Lotus japonicus]